MEYSNLFENNHREQGKAEKTIYYKKTTNQPPSTRKSTVFKASTIPHMNWNND